MNINQILEEIMQKNSIYDEIINNLITPRFDLKPELISEIAISFLENKEKIEEIYQQGYFKYYFINVVKNQVHSNTSPFHKNVRIQDYEYNDNTTVLDDNRDIENKILFEQKLELINKVYKDLKKNWFQSEMFHQYYILNKTYRQIENEFGVDHILVFHTIKKLKTRIKKEVDKYKKNL